MIENFAPQPYPLWAAWDVKDGTGWDHSLVVGWTRFGSDAPAPVVARYGRVVPLLAHNDNGWELFTDEEEAAETAAARDANLDREPAAKDGAA